MLHESTVRMSCASLRVEPFRRTVCVKGLTGEMRDELPVAQYSQHGAVLVGLDWTLFYLLAKFGHGSTTIVGKSDTVSAEVDSPSEGGLSLMPPDR